MFLELFEGKEPDIVLQPEQILFIEHSKADKAFIVHSGTIEISVRGNELTTLESNEIVGEMALVDDKSRFAMAVAGPNGAKLYSLDKESFLELIQSKPEFAVEVMKVMSERLRKWGELFD